MYARGTGGKATTFGVSGKLWRDALVMYDRRTRSLWSQVDGKAFRGPREGEVLERLPSTQTTWRNWKKRFPDTLVLEKPADLKSSHYRDYFGDPERLGIFGTRIEDRRLDGKEMIAGVHGRGFQIAFPLSGLPRGGLVNSGEGNRSVVLFAEKKGGIRAFSRRLSGRTLHFIDATRRKGLWQFHDRETGTLWNARTGEAIRGELQGERLIHLPVTETYWFAWLAFFPRTDLWLENGERKGS